MSAPVVPLPAEAEPGERRLSLREKRRLMQNGGSPRRGGPTGLAALEQLTKARGQRTRVLRGIQRTARARQAQEEEPKEEEKAEESGDVDTPEDGEAGRGPSPTVEDFKFKVTYNKSLKSALRSSSRPWSATKSLPRPLSATKRQHARRRSLTFSPRCQVKEGDGPVRWQSFDGLDDDTAPKPIMRQIVKREKPKELDLSDLIASDDSDNTSGYDTSTSSSDTEVEAQHPFLSDDDVDLGEPVVQSSASKTRNRESEDDKSAESQPVAEPTKAEEDAGDESLRELSERLDNMAREMTKVMRSVEQLARVVQVSTVKQEPLAAHVVENDANDGTGVDVDVDLSVPRVTTTQVVCSEAFRFVAVTVVGALYLVVIALLLRELRILDVSALLRASR